MRRRIPVDLVEHYGRKELTRSLGKSDPKEAQKHLPLVWAALGVEFEQTRAAPAQPATLAAELHPATVAAKMLATLP